MIMSISADFCCMVVRYFVISQNSRLLRIPKFETIANSLDSRLMRIDEIRDYCEYIKFETNANIQHNHKIRDYCEFLYY